MYPFSLILFAYHLHLLAEQDAELVAKVKSNLSEWIKEAKSMEATIYQEQSKTNNSTTTSAPPNYQPGNHQDSSNNQRSHPTYTPSNSNARNDNSPSNNAAPA